MTLVSILTPVFRGEPFLEGYFAAVLAQTLLDEIEVVLVHNEPSQAELDVVQRVMGAHPGLVNHIVFPADWDPESAPSRGSRSQALVSESYNRGLFAAQGRYVAQWDQDDIRPPDSLEVQSRALEAHPEALMAYGDMVMVGAYGATEGERIESPEYDRDLFMRGVFGGFRMWRRDSVEAVGPFDEQFSSGGDFDLWVRFAANGPQVRVPQVLGYWLNAGKGLSTSGDGVQPIERTVVELRYGILDKIDPRYLAAASRYRIGEIRVRDQWIPVERFTPDLDAILSRAATDPRLVPKASTGQRVGWALQRLARRVRAVLGPGGQQQ